MIGVLVGLGLLGGAIYGLARLEKGSADGGVGSASASATASAAPSAAPSGAPSASSVPAPSASTNATPVQDAAIADLDTTSVQDASIEVTDAGSTATATDAATATGATATSDRAAGAAGVRAELETTSPTGGLARGERPGKATKEAIAFAEEICVSAAPGVARCGSPEKTVVSVHALERDGYSGHEARVVAPAGAKPKDGGAETDACMVQEVLKVLDTRLDADRGALTDLEGRAFFTCTFGAK